MRIRAAVLNQTNQPFAIETVELEEPKAGEVLIKLAACGVCHSDYHLATGDTKHPLPAVAGHEGAGIVAAVGAGVTHVSPGDHVILSWAPDCGNCYFCQIGKPNLCDTYTSPLWAGTMLDGTPRLRKLDGSPIYHYCGTASFADYTVVPAPCCIPIDKKLPIETAALIGCAVATGVGATICTAPVKPGDSVVVLGAGGVGLSIVQGAKLCGATDIIVVDRFQSRLDYAKTFGATATVLADTDWQSAIKEQTGGRGASLCYEAVGSPRLQEQGLEAIRPGGTLVLVGLSPMGSNTNFPAAVLARQEKTVAGCYYGSISPRRDFPRLIELWKAGRLQLDQLVSKRYPLDQINQAYDDMLAGQNARGIVVMN